MFVNEAVREMEVQSFTHPVSVNIALGEFLYGLTRTLRPKLVVEIGCFIGFSTLHFAQALRENGQGRILSVDLFEPHFSSSSINSDIINPLDLAEHYRRKADLEDIITFIKGRSVEVKEQLATDLKDQIDLLFLDGDHTIRNVFSEFNMYYNDLKIGGYLLLHDVHPGRCGVYGPRVLIECLKYKRFIPRFLEIIEMETTDGYGLALLHKIHKRSIHVHPGPNVPVIKWGLIKYWRTPSQVSLTIRDSATQKPIPGALVRCQNPKGEGRSDSHGTLIAYPTPKTYLIDIFAEGYHPIKDYKLKVTRNWTLKQNKTLDVCIDLSKSNGQ